MREDNQQRHFMAEKKHIAFFIMWVAMGFFAILLAYFSVVMSISFSADVFMFAGIASASAASLVMLFRFRGASPVHGKLT